VPADLLACVFFHGISDHGLFIYGSDLSEQFSDRTYILDVHARFVFRDQCVRYQGLLCRRRCLLLTRIASRPFGSPNGFAFSALGERSGQPDTWKRVVASDKIALFSLRCAHS
jgi:hypothetical protein